MKASYRVTNRENYRTWKVLNKGGPYWYIKDVVFDDPVPGVRINKEPPMPKSDAGFKEGDPEFVAKVDEKVAETLKEEVKKWLNKSFFLIHSRL